MANKVKIYCQNVWGIRSYEKRCKIFRKCQKSSSSVFLLQETHSTSEVEDIWKTQWGGEIFFSHGKNDARGVCILFKNNINFKVHNSVEDGDGRFLILDVSFGDKRLTLANVYGPNTDDPSFFLALANKIEDIDNVEKVIAGDFNCIMDAELDKSGGNPKAHYKTRNLITTWMEEADLVDIWRIRNPDSKQFTWYRLRPSPIFERLDYFLVSSSLCNQVEDVDILPAYVSDHSVITLSVVICGETKGPGYWKLNCSLLHDQKYVEHINKVIRDTSTKNKMEKLDPLLSWEMIKLSIRGETIKFSKQRARKEKGIQKKLEQNLKTLEANEESISANHEEIDRIKRQLDNELDKQAKGAAIRARVRWIEEGEKSTKYFFNLEKRKSRQKTITRIYNSQGNIVTDNRSILQEEQKFYKKIYTSSIPKEQSQKENIIDFMDTHPDQLPQLSELEKASCEGVFTEKELSEALKSTHNNKSPGLDGIPADFYKVFWKDLKQHLLEAFNFSYTDTGKLSNTQRQGVLCLLPKKDKDTLHLKNWRPISLLNGDYKLATKIIAFRIKSVLKSIIHSDQTGFIKDRYIGENINKIMNVIDYTNLNEIPAILVCIDFEKAFDFIEWEYIFQCLKVFNFGPSLISWIKTIYNELYTSVSNNGWISENFLITRSVRQGCPLSPYLFIIAVEILAIAIRNNKNINSLLYNNLKIKISQYADDTTLLLPFCRETLTHTFNSFDAFRHISGLVINLDKTEIMRLGSIRKSDAILIPEKKIKWTNNSVKILGVHIYSNTQDTILYNFPPLRQKIKNIIAVWQWRNLTLYGRILLAKSLLISQLIYMMSVLPNPDQKFINEIEQIILDYIWGFKKHKLNKNILYAPLMEGGLNMMSLICQSKAIKLTWVGRMLSNNNQGIWKDIVYTQLGILGPNIWLCNLKATDSIILTSNISSTFWKDVVRMWCEYSFTVPTGKEDVENQFLWYNSHLRKNNKPFFMKRLYENNIHYLKDLLDENQNVYCYENFIIKYNINIDFVSFYGLISSIPRDWLQILNNNDEGNGLRAKKLDVVMAEDRACKQIYSDIIVSYYVIPTKAKLKWEAELTITISDDTWRQYFQNIYKTTCNVQLRYFQFQLLHHILTTNRDAFRWKLSTVDTCTFCDNAPETLKHLLWECTITQYFWHRVFSWVKFCTGSNIRFNETEILFGILMDNFLPFNYIFLVAKKYIYSCKAGKKQPNHNQFISICKKEYEIESTIQKKKGNANKFKETWNLFQGSL